MVSSKAVVLLLLIHFLLILSVGVGLVLLFSTLCPSRFVLSHLDGKEKADCIT